MNSFNEISRANKLSVLITVLMLGLVLVLLSSHASAGITLKQKSWKQWDAPGKRHVGYNKLADWSKAMWCPKGEAQYCGERSMTTGTSNCTRTNANIGFNYDAPLPAAAGRLKFNGGWSRQWEVCSQRSDTSTCYARSGKWTRNEVKQNIRWAAKTVHGSYDAVKVSLGEKCSKNGRGVRVCREQYNYECPNGGSKVKRRRGPTHKFICEYSGNDVKNAWFTYKDFTTCGYYNSLP